jgi:hypothetical protein
MFVKNKNLDIKSFILWAGTEHKIIVGYFEEMPKQKNNIYFD